MTDWDAGPSLTQNYSAFVSSIDGRLNDAANMFDGVGTNLPDDTIKWDTGTSQFQQYSSASTEWNPLASVFEMTVSAANNLAGNGRNIFVNNSNENPNISDTSLSIHSIGTLTQWHSVGPTSPGTADAIWTALDSIPTDVDWIEIKVYATDTVTSTADNNYGIDLYARGGGGSQATGLDNQILSFRTNFPSSGIYRAGGFGAGIKIQVDSNLEFDLNLLAITGDPDGDVIAYAILTGYGWN